MSDSPAPPRFSLPRISVGWIIALIVFLAALLSLFVSLSIDPIKLHAILIALLALALLIG